MKSLLRYLLRLWAKIGVAPGILHQWVDQYSQTLHVPNLKRSVIGKNVIQCNLKDHVQSRIYFLGAYEPIEAFLFMELIKPDMHIIDAGANIGFYSLIASSKLSERGKVFSFEPVPSNYEQLEYNIKKSNNSKIEVIKMGLWNKEDTLKFSLDETHSDNHGSFTAGKVTNSSQYFECPVNSLDSLLDNETIPKVDLIKMDIEGSELFALQGAIKSIESYKPTILMEINKFACNSFGYSSTEIDSLLLPLGYKIFKVESLPENSGYMDSTESITQSNVFYISPKDQQRFKDQWDYKKIKKMFASY